MAVAVLVAALAVLGGSALGAQSWSGKVSDNENVISFRAKFEAGELTVEFELAVNPDDPKGGTFKTYALDNTARGGTSGDTSLAASGDITLTGPWTSSEVKSVGTMEVPDYGFKGKGWFKAPAQASMDGLGEVVVEGMVCSEFSCFPAHTVTIPVPVSVSQNQGAAAPPPPSGSQPKTTGTLPTPWSSVAHGPDDDNSRVRYRARLDQIEGALTLVVEAEHDDHWHTYDFRNSQRKGFSTDTSITVSGALSANGEWRASREPHQKTFDEETAKYLGGALYDFYWDGTVQFFLPVRRVPGDTATLAITAMVCEEACFDIKGVPLTIAVPDWIELSKDPPAGSGTPKPNTATGKPPAGGTLYEATSKTGQKSWLLSQFNGKADGSDVSGGDDWGTFIVACILGGLVALLMPCVFPMIPITVSFFGKQAEQRGGSTVTLGLVYVFGVIFSYSAIGSVLTALRGASGVTDFAQSAEVQVAIAALFLVFALSMFGMFELRLPYAIQQKFNFQGKSSGGMLGSFLLGTAFAVTSMACTVPVVGSIFALATEGHWLRPLVGMVVFSSVVAAPFFVLAIIPGALKKLPRAGGWMNSIKVVFGFIELAAAAEFLGIAGWLDRAWVLSVWIACFAMVGLYLLGIFRGRHDAGISGASPIAMFFATVFLGFAMWFSHGLYGGNLGWVESFLRNELGWEKNVDLRTKLAEAKAARQPVFLDFTGTNCANCRLFEKGALDQEWAKVALAKYGKYSLYTDSKPHGGSYVELTRKLFGYVGQPAYAVVNPDGEITAWLADINTVLKADNPQAVFEAFVKTGEGKGYQWDFDKGFAPPKN
jgi:thiol:disulfide interchange protein DsbD